MKKILLFGLLFFSIAVKAQCWRQISGGYFHMAAIKADGSLWAWGSNEKGQLGTGTGADSAVPVQVGDDTDWAYVDCGARHTIALKNNGTLWAWGHNDVGQAGSGNYADINVPTQIGTASDWAFIDAGGYHNFALKTNGDLWGWGVNMNNQLGDNTTINRNIPVQLGTSTWLTVSAGDYHSAGIKSNGKLFTWGNNSAGQLCNGQNGLNFNIPIQVSNDTDWSVVKCGQENTVLLKADGTLWAGGDNFGVTLMQAATGSNWTNIATSTSTVYAINSDGELWAAGDNFAGQIGNDTQDFTYDFTPVNGDTDWIAASGAGWAACALKSDGSVWTWGSGENGQSGTGNIDSTLLSPVMISCPQTLVLQERTVPTFKIYPNPAKHLVNIDSGEMTIENLSIYDLRGKIVFQQSGGHTQIDVSNLQAGIYFVKVRDAQSTNYLRLIKE